MPTTVAPGSIDSTTTAPIPTTAPAPISMWSRTRAPRPMNACSWTCVPPPMTAPGRDVAAGADDDVVLDDRGAVHDGVAADAGAGVHDGAARGPRRQAPAWRSGRPRPRRGRWSPTARPSNRSVVAVRAARAPLVVTATEAKDEPRPVVRGEVFETRGERGVVTEPRHVRGRGGARPPGRRTPARPSGPLASGPHR